MIPRVLKQKILCFVLAILNVPFLAAPADAQVVYNSQEDIYTQDFNSLPSTGSGFTWTDNTTLPGWYATNSASPSFNPGGVSVGSTTIGDLYSFGNSGSSDRSLGTIGSGTVGNFYYGLKLVNNTGTTITGFRVSYTGEQWRNSASAAQALTFQYSLSATAVNSGSYVTVSALGFSSPVSGGTAGAADGNSGVARSVITPVTIVNINWVPGSVLWLRFSDPDHTGNDHGLGIDDFSFSATGAAQLNDPPAGYYASAQGLTGQALAGALHNIISPHTVIPYTASSGIDTWAALKVLEQDPADSTKVRLVYSDASVLKTEATWNREHLWPRSRGIFDDGADYSDLFNLRAAYSTVNTARSNKVFDFSNSQDPNYHSPAHTLAATGTSTDTDSWQPGSDERGDIARALFYMDVRYDGNSSADPNTTDLVLENGIINSSDMAVLATLVQWHQEDPVSEIERQRNHSIYTLYQHNRNPFVDHPEYVDQIFGDDVRLAEDSDLDGIPSVWETGHQFNPNNSGDASQDADSDGFSNFEEYWMGSDPRSASSPIKLIVDGSYTGSIENGSALQPFKRLQPAIDVVPPTELRAIFVRPGTYNERPYINGKNNIHLFSQAGAELTIIDGQHVNSSVVRIYDFQRATFSGFTVRNAQTNNFGAGLRVDSPNGSILVARNVLKSNTTSNGSTGGGGFYLKAATGSRVENNLILGNSALRGGAVLFAGGDVKFWHNTVVGNIATGGLGGGLSALTGVKPDVRNNIVWANTGSGLNTQLHQIISSGNIIQGAAADSGNLSANPQFINASQGDYHLAAISPAKDSAVSIPLAEDFERNIRPELGGTLKDIGAHEFVPDNDTDDDGLSDDWETAHFGNLSYNGSDDPDGDGLSNLSEISGGTDPNDFYNGFTPTIQVVSGDAQNGLRNTFLPLPLVVKIVDANSNPLPNVPLEISANQGSLLGETPSYGNSLAATLNVRTQSDGKVTVFCYTRPTAGVFDVSFVGTAPGATLTTTFHEVAINPTAPPQDPNPPYDISSRLNSNTKRVYVNTYGDYVAESKVTDTYVWLWHVDSLSPEGTFASPAELNALESAVAATGIAFIQRPYPVAINSLRHVLFEGFVDGGLRQFIWRPESTLIVLPPISARPIMHTLNDNDGVSWKIQDATTQNKPRTYVCLPGGTTFERILPAVESVSGMLLPDSTVVGWALWRPSIYVPYVKSSFFWSPEDNSGTWFQPPGASSSAVLAVNADGVIAGSIEAPDFRLFVRRNSEYLISAPLPSATTIMKINQKVGGDLDVLAGQRVWILRQTVNAWQQQMIDLTLPPGVVSQEPIGITNQGTVWGTAVDQRGRARPAVWFQKVSIDGTCSYHFSYLKDLLPSWKKEELGNIIDFGNSGQILATGFLEPDHQLYRLTPLDDSDRDGMPDFWEWANGTNFVNADGNADLDDGYTYILDNLSEYLAGTNPIVRDTDGDGIPDGWEVQHGYDPRKIEDGSWDLDGDGLTTLQEYNFGTYSTVQYEVIPLSDFFLWGGMRGMTMNTPAGNDPLTVAASYIDTGSGFSHTERARVSSDFSSANVAWLDNCVIKAVNDAGTAVGYYLDSDQPSAFVLPGSEYNLYNARFAIFPNYSGPSWATGISQDGTRVTGIYHPSINQMGCGFEWRLSDNLFANILPDRAAYVQDLHIAPSGAIFGSYIDPVQYTLHGFTLHSGITSYLEDTPLLGSPTITVLQSINLRGDFLYTAFSSNYTPGTDALRVLQNQTPQRLGLLPGLGRASGYASAMNDQRQVVGAAVTPSGVEHGFLSVETIRNSGVWKTQDLNAMINADLYEITDATAINNRGEILANAISSDANANGSNAILLLRPTIQDTDIDGLKDDWEMYYYGSLDVNLDSPAPRGDGMTIGEVISRGLDLFNSDSDHDGIPDVVEIAEGLNPLNPQDANQDIDGDNLSNLEEYVRGTNMHSADSDMDGVNDWLEVQLGMNPLNASDAGVDSDGDGLSNVSENANGTNPFNADTDADQIPDGWEMLAGIDPLNSSDANTEAPNEDGLTYVELYRAGANPSTIGAGGSSRRKIFLSTRTKKLSFSLRPTISQIPTGFSNFFVWEQRTSGPSHDSFNGDADLLSNYIDWQDPRDEPGGEITEEFSPTTEEEYQLHPNDPAYIMVSGTMDDPNAEPTAISGIFSLSNNDQKFKQRIVTTSNVFDPGQATNFITGRSYGRTRTAQGFSASWGWEGDGTLGMQSKSATARWIDSQSALFEWREVRMQTNIPPAEGREIVRDFLIIKETEAATGSITTEVESRVITISSGESYSEAMLLEPVANVLGEKVKEYLVPVEISKMWSDQFPEVTDANFLPNQTGGQNRPYILMGACQSNNFDLKGHLKAKIKVGGPMEIRNKILWRLATNVDNEFIPEDGDSTYDASEDTVTIVLNSVSQDDEYSYFLVAGYDQDGDGQLSSTEVAIRPTFKWHHTGAEGEPVTDNHEYEVKIVSRDTYNDSNTGTFGLSNISNNVWAPGGLIQASRCMNAFLTEGVPEGSTSSATTVAKNDFRLTHAVGLIFPAPGGPGPTINATFGKNSQMADDVANAHAVYVLLANRLTGKKDEVHQRFADSSNDIESFTWHFAGGSLNFGNASDPDMFLALGDTLLSSFDVTVDVHRDGYTIDSLALSGTITDLYDFDFDGPPRWPEFVRKAARIQSGYNTLGIAGRIYTNEIKMENNSCRQMEGTTVLQ